MIREIAIEPELIIEWSNKEFRREFKPIDIRDEYGIGSPKKMSRYPRKWRALLGELLKGFQEDPLRQKRVEELAKAVIEHSIKRRECTWEEASNWYKNALKEDMRVPFEVICCRANFKAIEKAVSLEDFRQENEEKLNLLKLPRGATPRRNKEDLVSTLMPWLRYSKNIVIVDPYFDANNRRYSEPLKELIGNVFTNCDQKNYPYFEIIRNFDDKTPSKEHLINGFETWICDNIPKGFEILFTLFEEKQRGEEIHQRYILTELGGVAIDPGFATQDDPAGNDTYDINLLDQKQFLKRWDQYYINDATFRFEDQFIFTKND